MSKVSFLAVVALAAFGAMVLAGAGSAAKPTASASTPRVQSTWTGPGVVRQVGLRNYAGPNCPGKGWNCTTSTRVLQVATAGGSNTVNCTAAACEIHQTGTGTNTARCTQSSIFPSAAQSCIITQTGATNNAYVNQSINQSVPISPAGTTQSGKQTVNITQGPASVLNYLQIQQNTNQSLKTNNPTQTQVAGQSINVEQTTTGAGANSSSINQTQLQKEYARGTTQNQNVTTTVDDCNPNTVLTPGPTAPNTCAVVLQHSASGNNSNSLRQNVLEDINSTGRATQTQGSTAGGIDARVHQDTVSGRSTNNAALAKLQHETGASGSTQAQHDPVSCCGFASQDGGTNNTENINLTSSESASGDSSPNQTSNLIGTSHTPDGTCTITVNASINGDSANKSDTESPCPFLTLQAECNSDGCTASPPDLTNPAPPESALEKLVASGDSGFDNSTSVLGGGTVEYQITYGNNGTGDAHNVVVTDTLPTDATYVADSCSPSTICSYNSDTRTITWNLGTVGPTIEIGRVMGFSATVPNETADIVNTASVDTTEESPISSNSATVQDTLAAPVSGLSKLVRQANTNNGFDNSVGLTGGGTAEFQLLYSNSGNGDAHNVVVTDVVPAGMTFVGCTLSCSYDGNTQTITWNLGTVAPTGASPTEMRFTASAPNVDASYDNTATVDTDEESPVSSGTATVVTFFLG